MYNKFYQYKEYILKHKYLISICVMSLIVVVYLFLQNYENIELNQKNDELVTSNNLDNQSSKEHKEQDKSVASSKQNKSQVNKIYVDIKGAVENPTVYEMKSTDRVIDLIKKVKLTKEADLSKINLSEKLIDQKLIYIPTKNESNNTLFTGSNQNTSDNKTKQVNLNTASETELTNVPGIGPSKAKDIIKFKEENGSFNSIDDLKKIKGIGDKTFEKLKSHFTI